jgi:hypothetical protein
MLNLGAGLLLPVYMAAGVSAAFAQKVPTEISVDTSGGFARIVYRFNGDVDADVRMSNGILIISFNVPVEASADRLNSAPDICARRPPRSGRQGPAYSACAQGHLAFHAGK